MTNQNWPFGHLNKDKCSLTAKHIAGSDLSKYGNEETIKELKRYFLIRHIRKRRVTMESEIVDQSWHEFILDTWNYTNFCELAFGGYLHHHTDYYEPDMNFEVTYWELFGESPHAMWDNSSSYSRQFFNLERDNYNDQGPEDLSDQNCA